MAKRVGLPSLSRFWYDAEVFIELTGDDATEVLGGLKILEVGERYETLVDPGSITATRVCFSASEIL